ncbi:hypothetical protein JCM33374_g1945 [Metschnikowia sp. JCM 33374]|nr:hypothetical protein JCM33374_g1945 [Metschnikowia sp. JCM 33374]
MAPPKRKNNPQKSSGYDGKRHRPNHGRQQLRHVTRTARRDGPVQEEAAGAESSGEDEENQLPDELEQPKKFQEGKAYDALLTLLKAEQKTGEKADKRPKNRKQSASGSSSTNGEGEEREKDQAEDDDDEAIAGANMQESSDEDSGSEEEEFFDLDENGDGTEGDNDRGDSTLSKDPFEAHFNLVSDEQVAQESNASHQGKWPVTDKRAIEGSAYLASVQVPPNGPITKSTVKPAHSFSEFATVKSRIRSEYLAHYADPLKPLDASLLRDMLEYRDVSYTYQSYKNTSYQKLYLTHVLNHTFKTRDRILKNNEKIRAYGDALKHGTLKPGATEPELRDQGFTRPKALILLPTRNAAYEVVEQLIRMSGSDQQENRKKFKHQFYEEGMPPETKPADFRHMFKGNSSDFFSLGIKFTRKTVKLYSSFFNSDVLIASPIGLSMILEDPKQSKREYDFLSSIEILVIDQANQIEMQNWDHVATVLKYVNKIPKNFHGADFSRIRMWAINDQAKYLRQTLVFNEFATPSVNSVISKSCNLAGKARYRPVITSKTCIMNSVGLKIKQIFQRFDAPDPQTNYESRYKFFINSILPSITKQSSYEDGLLIYIPSYFDYVRVKAYMKNHTKYDFASIDEYSSKPKVSRARHNFATGKVKLLLYTERMHHFRRYELGGVKNILIYETPANPQFYKELLKFVGKSIYNGQADVDLSFVKTLYSKWDATALERVVGNERAPVLCNAVNELYEFR